ncbi:hypothetical protein V6N11_062559 [Hibiscus sabdariffa]|uniref:Uncharacterized protein n=1 Tax=Hibiscus sabdariffa TaxID=183260 RepID=A0ABR2PSY8_9ROSI
MDPRPGEGRYFTELEVLFWSGKWFLCTSIHLSPKSRGGPFTPKWTQRNMVFAPLLSVHDAGVVLGLVRRLLAGRHRGFVQKDGRGSPCLCLISPHHLLLTRSVQTRL